MLGREGSTMSDAKRRTIRTLLQLIASGGLTALVAAVADGLTATQAASVLAAWNIVVTFSQNWAEDNTTFPAVFKAPASSGVNPEPSSWE